MIPRLTRLMSTSCRNFTARVGPIISPVPCAMFGDLTLHAKALHDKGFAVFDIRGAGVFREELLSLVVFRQLVSTEVSVRERVVREAWRGLECNHGDSVTSLDATIFDSIIGASCTRWVSELVGFLCAPCAVREVALQRHVRVRPPQRACACHGAAL